jgi:protease II
MITPGLNEGYKSSRFNFFVSTPLIYNEAYEYDISQKKLTQLNRCELTGPKFDKTQFKSSVVLAPS